MQHVKLIACFLGFITVSFGQQAKPKLVVGVVVDQMCYEYLYRYQSRFSKNGFTKLMKNGTHCRNTQYNYVPTYTGPGHASIYTGTTPSNHGIVGNDWYNRSLGREVNCVEDTSVFSVGTTSNEGKCSPQFLKAHTITDQLKLTYSDSKVISMSIKNRGAILPGGHLSDGSYWFDYASGSFVTSSFYTDKLPSWVESFNALKFPDHYLKQTWNTMYPLETYTASGPDDSPYEHTLGSKTTPTFPYELANLKGSKSGYDLFTYTPFSNTYLTDFALKALESEKLGQQKSTDFLCISYSTPDIAGHAFGPYSVEIEDMYLRLDVEIARLLSALEKQVGKGNFVFFITADHAVVPVPQYLVDKQLPGGYIFNNPRMAELRKSVVTKFGVDFILLNENNNIYFDRKLMKQSNIEAELAQLFVKNEIRSWEGVKRVFTATELENGATDNEWMDMVRLGYRYEESGDVLYLLEPGYLPKAAPNEKTHKGTSHGSSFNYDTHVPLIWYGANIPKQEVIRRTHITDISATLTHILQLQKPNATTGEPILELFRTN
jgi:predicted AlkP superfamily pyrophosphatase or phosphodiesterase